MSRSSGVVVVAAPAGTGMVRRYAGPSTLDRATTPSAAMRNAALQQAADSTATSDYPDLAPDRLDMASEAVPGDGQA